MKITSNAWAAGLAAAALLLAGCGGTPDAAAELPDDLMSDDLGVDAADDDVEEAAAEAVEEDRLPDVVGLSVDEATQVLEDLGFEVRTGVVRTTETQPDFVHRSEPPPGALIRPGQGIVLRIAAEPEG